jgi:hypothetical protein
MENAKQTGQTRTVKNRVWHMLNVLMMALGWFVSSLVIVVYLYLIYIDWRASSRYYPVQTVSSTPTVYITPTAVVTNKPTRVPTPTSTIEVLTDSNSKTLMYPSLDYPIFSFFYPKDWIIVEHTGFPEGGPAPTILYLHRPNTVYSERYASEEITIHAVQQSPDFDWHTKWREEIVKCNGDRYTSDGHRPGPIFPVTMNGISGEACSLDQTYHTWTVVLFNIEYEHQNGRKLPLKIEVKSIVGAPLETQEELFNAKPELQQILSSLHLY